MKPKIYLASRFSRKNECKEIRKRLNELGYTVISRWLDTEWNEVTENGASSAAPPERRAEFAAKDLNDVLEADMIVSLTEDPSTKANGRGGRHFEMGAAYALGKKCVIIGPHEHIFHHLPNVIRYELWDIEQFISDLDNTNFYDV